MADFKEYIKDLQSIPVSELTEHSKRSALEKLIKDISNEVSIEIKVLHEPKRAKNYGSPDFRIYTNASIIGYIENKKIDENLDKILKSEQIKKYKELSNNILLTNYIEFIWIRDGETLKRETLCYLSDLEKQKFKPDKSKENTIEELIKNFLSEAPKGIANAKDLAQALAVRSRNLHDFLNTELARQEKEHTEGKLWGLYQTFKTSIFNELTITEFSDAFAQMLCYGLFLAKLNADTNVVTLSNAKDFIPQAFELIKELVNFLDELEKEEYRETKWIVEEVISLLNNLDLPELQASLSFNKGRGKVADPYVYFYEDFLGAYNPKLRKAKGVYYTPPPVVHFIVKAVNNLLKTEFEISQGLADYKKVTVLDFATGTGTFLLEVFEQIFQTIPTESKAKRGLIVKEHILKNIYGFEFLIAPYTVAHLKLSQYLKEQGYTLENKERLQILLTNTLENISPQGTFLLPALTHEGIMANDVKRKPILVITGNPPYSGHSKNPSEKTIEITKGDSYVSHYKWNTTTNNIDQVLKVAKHNMNVKQKTFIGEKLMNYFFVDGSPLGEKNPKWLQDDYVKFIRFAQDKMDKVDEGIVAIITNHSFLDNPTFKGMRQSLMNSFDRLYFLDLHGNAKKKEKTPEGGKDENVFDIEQGVAISILIKKKGIEKKVLHSDFYGTRLFKYNLCIWNTIESLTWKEVEPSAPFYLFTPQNNGLKEIYGKGYKTTDIFIVSSVGIVTADDSTLINGDRKFLLDSVLNKYQENKNEFVEPISYRPFDNKFIYYNTIIVERARKEVMGHLLQKNIGLLVGRAGQVVGEGLWNLCFISNKIVDFNIFYRGGELAFPLFLYHKGTGIFDGINEISIQENFKNDFRSFIDKEYNNHYTPEQVLGYIYGVLYSPVYRSKYAEFLKIDFPRIPFAKDKSTFEKVSVLGWNLIQTHLLNEIPKGNDYNDLGTYTGDGNNIVEKTEYSTNKLYINKTEYFDNVPPAVFEFYIGGYQVLSKYLKDRKGCTLTLDEITNIENVVKVLYFTIEQMKRIEIETKEWV